MQEPSEKECKLKQLEKLDDRALWYGSQYWQVPLVFLGAVGVVAVQVIDKSGAYPLLVPWFAFLSSGAGAIVLWHMFMIDKNYRRLVANIVRLEDELGVRYRDEFKNDRESATQLEGTPGDHRRPMLFLQAATTATLFLLGFARVCQYIGP